MSTVLLFGPTVCANQDRLQQLLTTNWRIIAIADESARGQLQRALPQAGGAGKQV